MIKPTTGRVVLFNHLGLHSNRPCHDAKLAAIVTHVWSDSCVNLCVFDSNGESFGLTSVTLIQDGDAPHSYHYCEWMPYQKGQAAKHDALEVAAAARAAGPTNY